MGAPFSLSNITDQKNKNRPVERRGRVIGALFNRAILDPDSNLCYGEGGAGTWSDGKLTTRIGRNSENVRKVLYLFVFMYSVSSDKNLAYDTNDE